MQTWRVKSDDTRDGLSRWASGLSEAFVPLEPVETSVDGFYGRIKKTSTDALDVSLVTSSGHEVRRLNEHIRARAQDVCFVNVLRHGRSFVSQHASYEVSPMDISIVDTREPFSIRHDYPFELISITVPSDWLVAADVRHHALSRSPLGRELSHVVWGLSQSLLQSRDGSGDIRDALAAQLRSTLGIVSAVSGHADAAMDRSAMLRSYVERHHANPNLSAATLSAHFGLSLRRVHQLFEPGGRSVSEYVNDVRLDRAAKLLGSDAALHRTIADIAWEVGYADPAYFNRRFRRKFGCTPRDYRERRAGGYAAQ